MDKKRLSQLRLLLKKNNFGAILISSLANIIYLTDFAYFSDMEREAFLLFTPKNQFIFTDGRYTHAVKTHITDFELIEISGNQSLQEALQKCIKEEKIKTLGIEKNNLVVSEYEQMSELVNEIKNFSLSPLRIKKSTDELVKIQKACAIADQIFSTIVTQIKTGMSEQDIAKEMSLIMLQKNVTPSFPTIVASGENAAVPHHKTSDKKLQPNNIILLDFGVQFENYCSDMTRTLFFGKATPEQKTVYETVKNAQQRAIDFIEKKLIKKEIIKASDVDTVAKKYILENNFPSIPHSLGHGIGLQVHEAPRLSPASKEVLTNGMVFSIEPGIYLPDDMGVRIEDLFTIQDDQLIQLTKSPKDFIEIPQN
ncbi:MAG TPA: Xaa-Pro peptidase family protein [Methylomirabilota bacterium]|nr:Xaa-Pro peptidase family protein [Methylomirabilota bacterium]